DHSWQAQLRQPIFRLDTWFQFLQSKNVEAKAMADFAAEQQELIFRVTDSYMTILESNDRLDAANAERGAVKRQLEQVQQRFDVGLVAITDVLESTAAFDSSTVSVIEAEGAQVISFETLLRLTGQSFDNIDALDEGFPVEYPEPNDEEAWVQRALVGNYSLLAAQESVNSAQRNLYAAKSRHLPTLDATISYAESVSGGASFLGSEIEQKSAQLLLTVPVYSGGATHSAAKQAGYQLEQAQRTFDLTQRTTVENTRNLFSAINTDVARVNARQRGIDSSQSAFEATQTGYEVGTRNIVDVLLAQQRLYAAQFQYASARYQYVRDTLRLKQSVGSLSPDDIYGINNFISSGKTVGRITPTTR
ncbi:MAG TPA: TolC family outer membrane protein, partial [Pseudomonadales bacterium]|nr:TolC family outer membrane protein [Pseudomonadales bacterium]